MKIIKYIVYLLASVGAISVIFLLILVKDLAIRDWKEIIYTVRRDQPSKQYDYVKLDFDSTANKASYVLHVPITQVVDCIESHPFRDFGGNFSSIDDSTYFMGRYKGESFVYRMKGKGLNESVSFVLKLNSLSCDETRVSVCITRTETVAGRHDVVSSDGILEYSILYYFGKLLDEKNMPKIVFPKELSREEIVNTYKSFNFDDSCPFTEEELFGSAN